MLNREGEWTSENKRWLSIQEKVENIVYKWKCFIFEYIFSLLSHSSLFFFRVLFATHLRALARSPIHMYYIFLCFQWFYVTLYTLTQISMARYIYGCEFDFHFHFYFDTLCNPSQSITITIHHHSTFCHSTGLHAQNA